MPRHFDLIIIGGGINGSGIARDAAMRGLTTLLVEKKDFGSGTSERSSRLIHGGLRYLEQGDIGLVFESLQERERLLRIAPHLVAPLRFLIPIYKQSKRPFWFVTVGMILYDLLSFLKSLPRFERLSKSKVLQREPGLERQGLLGGVEYSDAQVAYVERLCLANVLSAREAGAEVRNYTEVRSLIKRGNRITGVKLCDVLTGHEELVTGSLVVNAAGPWVDHVLGTGKFTTKRKIGGTKGSHILIPTAKLGGKSMERAVYNEARSDGRPFFIIPYRDGIFIGTTDEHVDEELDTLAPREHEIDYLLKETKVIFPKARISRKDIRYTMAGWRPLPYKGRREPGQIPRSHVIFDHEQDGVHGLLSVIGGKITTYRNLAEEAVDLAIKKLGKSFRMSMRPFRPLRPFACTTAKLAVHGGNIPDFELFRKEKRGELKDRFNLSAAVADHLISLYGTEIDQVLQYAERDSALLKPLCAGGLDIGAQVPFALDFEMARTLSDIIVRRTAMISARNKGMPCYTEVARLMAAHLGWSRMREKEEVHNFLKEYETLYTIKPN